ncbi:alpha-galactosidase [Maribellus sp. YY47]|uniref:alpha-galactosidase n=1 Tax=Maribellus sp. YY47 TaxID=2929486 RepID=UPI00200116B6|nr:alpha-galactosidase [Maribellus sp. YY47]MCK3683909.1 alpha-galactosidase [Maribellus sp. YY47]
MRILSQNKKDAFTILLGTLFFMLCITDAKAQTQAFLKNDTLSLSNSMIKRQFLWNNGELLSLDLVDVRSGKKLLVQSNLPVFRTTKNFSVKESSFKTEKVAEDNLNYAHLTAEVLLDYGSFKLKRIFRIYENVPAISCENYLWVDQDSELGKAAAFLQTPIQLENINSVIKYPHLKAVEFFDRTDHNNNLVKEEEALAFRSDLGLKGNLLQVSSPQAEEPGFFILKEAPCSFVQLSYLGYDFKSTRNAISVAGAGISTQSLIKGEWVKLYGTVVGVYDSPELGFMHALHTYQRSVRKTVAERDDMIMMNTWGDRNKDASISESFLKAELGACEKLGISHFQVDDGWQQGLSQNSAQASGNKWDSWSKEDWKPHAERLPNGFNPIVEYARKKNIELGLWFHPSNHNSYENWKTDAEIILNLYNTYNIRYFKIDGIMLPDKLADHRLRMLFDKVATESEGDVVINLDATAGNRTGYHYMNSYGNIFLENRYTDWGNFYPHWTLRNLWQLSAYVPSRNFQIEFLNKWRNKAVYGENDPLAPNAIPFEYQFAITMMAQPLAWFEGTGLPDEAMKIGSVIKKYRSIQADIHSGDIIPIGEEPGGFGWTGFQSVKDDRNGYLLVFREKNKEASCLMETYLPVGKNVVLTPVLGTGDKIKATPNSRREIQFELPNEFSYCLYQYVIED